MKGSEDKRKKGEINHPIVESGMNTNEIYTS